MVNNLTTTEEGYALDACQGKAIQDQIDIIATKIGKLYGAYSAFSEWSSSGLIPGSYTSGNARFVNASAANSPELIFVFTRDSGYEYISIRSPFGTFPDNYYFVNTTKGELKFYWQQSTGIIDIYANPMSLKQILYL